MAGRSSTLNMRARGGADTPVGSEERLPKWLVFSLLLHGVLIAAMFLAPMWPTKTREVPVYTVDLVGGEKIGRANFGTELTAVAKPRPVKKPESESKAAAVSEIKEPKKEIPPVEKVKPKPAEPKPVVPEKVETKPEPKPREEKKIAIKEKTQVAVAKPVPEKRESVKKEPTEVKSETSEATATDTASADSLRERLIQSAVDRAKARTESSPEASKGEVLSSGSGEGIGAAALGAGGRGGPGILKGIDFIAYQNRMLATIKENWAWVGQRSNLSVVVHFGIRENGEIFGLRIIKPSGDPSYDESVLRAVKKSSPLPAPPESYRRDFADVQLTFRPRDLGA